MTKIIAKNAGYVLFHDSAKKIVTLAKESEPSNPLISAKFIFDNSDGASILSGFQYHSDAKGLVKITADMVSDFLSANKDRCKLFCYAGKDEDEFVESKEYRSSNIDRLMLRENAKSIATSDIKLSNQIKIYRLDSKNVSANTISQMTMLLKKDTYWGADADEKYMQDAVVNSECMIATDQQDNVVGFVRFITNNDIAYISDMVVDSQWRKQQLGTALMQQACHHIDDQKHSFSALISAKEGDGQAAAPKLYGSKFGFNDYAVGHQHNIYFRYIRFNPEHQASFQKLNQVNANNFFNNQAKAMSSNSGAKLHSGPVPFFGELGTVHSRANTTEAYRYR